MNINYLKTVSLILLIFVEFSCNDAFMERYPLDQVSNEIYWNTENDLLVYNNYLYHLATDDANVPIMLGKGATGFAIGTYYTDLYSDNYNNYMYSAYNEVTRISTGKHIVPTSPTTTGWVGWSFVRTCNFGLANYDRAALLPSVRNKYIAEFLVIGKPSRIPTFDYTDPQPVWVYFLAHGSIDLPLCFQLYH